MRKLAFLIMALFWTVANAREIRLCYEESSLFPWITGDEKGLAFVQLSTVEKNLKIKFLYTRMPWKRCQQEVKFGKFDGLVSSSFSEPRLEWSVYPTNDKGELNREQRMHTDTYYIYVRRDSNIHFKDGKFVNLNKNPIGVQLGSSVKHDLSLKGYNSFAPHSNIEDLIKDLDYGNIQTAIMLGFETQRILASKPRYKKNITRLPEEFKIADQYLIFNKKFFENNKELCRSIWDMLPEARNSQQYLKLSEALLGNHNKLP